MPVGGMSPPPAGRVPTRLEGMETYCVLLPVVQGVSVPTRLEGMETVIDKRHNLITLPVPTRLEGMETRFCKRIYDALQRSDPT